MSKKPITENRSMPPETLFPWFVSVSPQYYDDDADVGFSWEGWAVDEEDAILQALETCHLINDRDGEDRGDDMDPGQAKVHVAEIDFRRFAGPLVHWVRSIGGWNTPLWTAMEAAVHKAGLAVAPLTTLE